MKRSRASIVWSKIGWSSNVLNIIASIERFIGSTNKTLTIKSDAGISNINQYEAKEILKEYIEPLRALKKI